MEYTPAIRIERVDAQPGRQYPVTSSQTVESLLSTEEEQYLRVNPGSNL
jgi:hypothetical protein